MRRDSGSLISSIVLLAVVLSATQAVASPTTEPEKQSSYLKRKAPKAKILAPQCSLDQGVNGCAASGVVPKHLALTGGRGRTDDAKSKWIFQGPPRNTLPFENDISLPKKPPVGGLVGLEFPF
jgi:hypothetical protein